MQLERPACNFVMATSSFFFTASSDGARTAPGRSTNVTDEYSICFSLGLPRPPPPSSRPPRPPRRPLAAS